MQVLGAISYLMPLTSTLLLVVLGRNEISPASMAGAAMVLSGAVIADMGRKTGEKATV
jgi:drug/metabolite transporter (DMT)-like permease